LLNLNIYASPKTKETSMNQETEQPCEMHIICGPSGSGKTDFAEQLQRENTDRYFTPYYENRDNLRVQLAGVDTDLLARYSWDTMIEKYREADQAWFAELQRMLSARHKMILVEWPFHRPEEMTQMINIARAAGFTPIVHMLYFKDSKELIERDIIRTQNKGRVTNPGEAQDAIDSGKVALWVKQSIRLQQAFPAIFDLCRNLGVSITLYNTFRGRLGSRDGKYPSVAKREVVKAEAGEDLEAGNERDTWHRYANFRRTAYLNPEADFECVVSDDPRKYLTVSLGNNLYQPDTPSIDDIIQREVPERYHNQAEREKEPKRGVYWHITQHLRAREDGTDEEHTR
jgi:predicted ABC-type ATPase